MPKRPGPKSACKRRPELEKPVVQLSLTTDKNMYEMTRMLNQKRLFCQIRGSGSDFVGYSVLDFKEERPAERSKAKFGLFQDLTQFNEINHTINKQKDY
jgi:hypothetical protein